MEPRQSATILIVDDDEDILELFEENLSFMGDYSIVKAYSGKEALVLIEKAPPDLILLDIMMEDMDGTTVCKAIKSGEKTSHIPVIAVTAIHKVHEPRYREIMDSGVDEYLEKPFEYDELKGAIEQQLERLR